MKYILAALILDDMKRRDSHFNLGAVMSELEDPPDMEEKLIDIASEGTPRADRSTQELHSNIEDETELNDFQLDFFGDGI